MSTDQIEQISAHTAFSGEGKGLEIRAAKWRLAFSSFIQARKRPTGLNISKFAAHVGVGVGTISAWLNGTEAPSRARALWVASKFGMKSKITKIWRSIFSFRRPAKTKTAPIPRGCRVMTLAEMAARPMPLRLARLYPVWPKF